jgi:hypothetical protein
MDHKDIYPRTQQGKDYISFVDEMYAKKHFYRLDNY